MVFRLVFITSLCTVLHKNGTLLYQSEYSNFAMYIISEKTLKKDSSTFLLYSRSLQSFIHGKRLDTNLYSMCMLIYKTVIYSVVVAVVAGKKLYIFTRATYCRRVQVIELLHIECVLLYPVSQKSVSTKWRIYKGKINSPQDFLL